MKRILSMIIIGLLLLSTLSMIAPKVKASPDVPPEVACVPFHGQLAAVPHDTWIGRETILKGTAHDKDGDGAMTAYKWDFGDGYSTDWISGVNPYIIEARHTYTGTMADGTPYGPSKYFTAWLYVKDTEGLEGKDSYFIAIRDKTLDVEVNVAIDNGLWWLHKQQIRGSYPDGAEYGYWNSPYGFYVASTSACTEAFELQGHSPNGDLGEDPYVETVQRGLNYLFNQFHSYSVYQDSTYCPFGNPDANGNGIGLGCYGPSEYLYESGMALMTISSTGTPNKIATTGSANVVGRAYKDIAQDMIDWFAWAQSDPVSGIYEGGWRYQANYEQSDNSVSQWPVIGMEAAEKNFGTSGVTVPSFVRPELLKWLAYSQGGDGGFGYQAPGSWENTAKTGAGCAMLSWAEVPTTDAKFQSALGFLNAHWYDTASSYTNFGDYYTMYAIMKGMRIPNPNVVSIGSHDWYAEYARYIVDEQNNYGNEYVVDHSWLAGYLSAEHATAWALATLTLTVTTPGPVAEAGSNVDNYPPTIPVKFDASGSYHRDPTKSIVLYEWDFDSDGTWDYSGTDLKVEHAYPAYYNPDGSIDWDKTAKDYTATLRVTDNSDPVLQDTDTCIIHITAPPWKPVADPDGPYEVSVGVSIQLDGSKSYDPESKMYPPGHPWYETIAKYEWDLDNDGKFDDSTDTKPSYEWDAAGIYSVGLKVTDSQASGPGGTIGPLDVDIKYTIVLVSKEARRFNPLIDGFYFENYARQTDCISMYTVQQIYDKIKSMFPADIPAYLVLTAAEMLYAWKAHEAHCFGMAKTAIYYYDHQSEIPTRYSQVYDILWDDKDDVPAARTMIENYQHEQVFTDINAIFNILLYFELNSVGSPLYPKAGLEVEAPAIMTMSQQLKPALLDLWGTETGDWKPVGHTVVAYECKQVDNGYDISTYDSNMPGQNHEFKLRRDLSGRLSIDDDGDPWFVWNDLVCVNAPLVGWTWDYIKDNAAHLIDWIKDNLKDLWDELKALRNQVPDLWNQFTDWASDNSKDIWDRLMRVKLFSHAQLNVYNSKGLHVGLTPDGNLDQEFNAMFLASDTMQLCVLPNPETGAFKVKLVGVSAGSYTLSLESIAQGVVVKEELITKEISEGDVHEYNLWLTPTGDFILDNTSPTTSLSIGDPKYTSGTTYVTPDTPFTLAAMDTGSGVKSTAYRINSTSYDSGWLTYTKPFNLTSLHDGNYTIGFNSTDNVGNVETTHEVSVTLFSWNYVFKDSDGRGTVLKVSTAYKFFQFTAPTKDFGVKYDSKMVQLGKQVIIICYEDKQMRLTATATNYETCLAIAWDKQTCKTYWLIEHPPAYTLTVYCKDATGKPISGASVYLNGCCKGQTDANGKLAMTNVLAGKYTVTAKKCGYKDTSSTTTINGDASLTLTMTAQTYTLTVCCKDSKGKAVSSANVYLNSNLKGATDLNGKLTITNLSAGTYTVTVKKSGYKDTSVNVTVIGDKTITITMMK